MNGFNQKPVKKEYTKHDSIIDLINYIGMVVFLYLFYSHLHSGLFLMAMDKIPYLSLRILLNPFTLMTVFISGILISRRRVDPAYFVFWAILLLIASSFAWNRLYISQYFPLFHLGYMSLIVGIMMIGIYLSLEAIQKLSVTPMTFSWWIKAIFFTGIGLCLFIPAMLFFADLLIVLSNESYLINIFKQDYLFFLGSVYIVCFSITLALLALYTHFNLKNVHGIGAPRCQIRRVQKSLYGRNPTLRDEMINQLWDTVIDAVQALPFINHPNLYFHQYSNGMIVPYLRTENYPFRTPPQKEQEKLAKLYRERHYNPHISLDTYKARFESHKLALDLLCNFIVTHTQSIAYLNEHYPYLSDIFTNKNKKVKSMEPEEAAPSKEIQALLDRLLKAPVPLRYEERSTQIYAIPSHALNYSLNLNNAYLDGSQLEGSYFTHASCQKITLCNAYLEKSNFNHSNIQEANLRCAQLQKSTFIGANCLHSSFDGCDITHVVFDDADCSHADFSNAQFEQTSFTNTITTKAIYTPLKSDKLTKQKNY